MEQPTERQQQVFDFIISYIDTNGCPPTLREISNHIGTKGTATAIGHLDALERKGYINRRESSSRSITIAGKTGTASIPLVGRVMAGQPSLAIETIEGYLNVDISWLHGDGCFFLRVSGDSMIDAHIIDGDLALIRPQRTAENGEIVVAMVDGEATLKRFYRGIDHIRLQPENMEMEPIIIKGVAAETIIIGKLLKTIRSFP